MNINDLVKQAVIFCDQIKSLSESEPVTHKTFAHYRLGINELFQVLTTHRQALAAYCDTYQITKDEYLFSLIDLMLGFLKKAIELSAEEPIEALLEKIQGEVEKAGVCVSEEDYSVALKAWRKDIIFTDRLNKYKHKFKQECHPLVPLIGEKISPSNTYLRASVLNKPALQDTQTYYRSEKHPLAKRLGSQSHVMYQANHLKYGERAHVGSYGNIMQTIGDKQAISRTVRATTRGTANLYDGLLSYKNTICQYVVNEIARKPTQLRTITVGFFNNYPCLMVHVKPNTMMYAGSNSPSEAAFEAWVDFLISYFIASINYKAFEENSLQIEMERRSSFGYLTPTISPTGRSMRINVGVIPSWYADLLVACLIDLDKLLAEKILDKKELPPTFPSMFYGSNAHVAYLENKYPCDHSTNLLQVLWARADKSGRTTLQNIARTPYALDGLAAQIFNNLKHGKHHAFNRGVTWAIKKLRIETQGKQTNLSFKQDSCIQFHRKEIPSDYRLKSDRVFWATIQSIVSAFKKNGDAIQIEAIEGVEYCCEENYINHLYYFLEQCCELTFVSAIEQAKKESIGDGYGSDSETENTLNEKTLYSKKVIIHNGMRAIWTAIIATTQYLSKQNMPCNICLDSSYYEAPLGIKLLAQLHSLQSINVMKQSSAANTLLFDLNACITDGNPNRDYTADDKKILILDATSTQTKHIKQHLARFATSRAAILFIVESGFKHQQIFADKNPYGAVRIFTKDKPLRDELYANIKKIDPPIQSSVSHRHRRQMKILGAVPTTQSFFGGTPDNNAMQPSTTSVSNFS